jgi:chromosome condensin MukBEF complex kleisin-like MukF subunit
MSERASTLLADIQREAALLRRHADTLESLARNMRISWQSHAYHLDRVKEHINVVGEHIAELQATRQDILPWQQQAINKVTSHAAQVATSAQAAISQLQENRNRLFVSEYRDQLTAIANHSEDMKEAVDEFLDYEKSQRKLQQLEDKLELAGG